MPRLCTRSLQLDRLTMPQPAAVWPSPPQCSPVTLIIFSSEYYQLLITTHLPTPEGWNAELA